MPTPSPQGLATPVRFVKGVGEARAAQLAALNVATVGDLLLTLPRRYEDRRFFLPMRQLRPGEPATVCGRVVTAAWVQPPRGKPCFEAVLTDGQGFVRCRWYGAAYLRDQIGRGDRLVAYGRVTRWRGECSLQHPEFERLEGEGDEPDASLHLGRVVPIYPLTGSLTQKAMRRMLWNALERFLPDVEEALPEETRRRHDLMPARDAVSQAHFPDTPALARPARERLAFEEFLSMQLVLAARKVRAERVLPGIAHAAPGALRERLLASLPFALTAAQRRVLEEIRADMARPHPMHRLLQGDVGSGKTVVAACAALDAIECGSQVAVMAPTEILAEQHLRTFTRYLGPLGVNLRLLSGSVGDRDGAEARAAVARGDVALVVGTHALIQERIAFRRLGLAIIDEQHKFGVEQRGLLYEKAEHPDVLVMTATPIPRTLAMTLYGDLDVSVIDEKPPGRGEVVTRVIKESQLPKAYEFIRQQVGKGRQAYLVYPLVSESETLELKSAEAMYAALGAGPLAGLRLGLLHGRLRPAEKDEVMERFRAGGLDVLVATTVIEVGVDVANATVMLVEHAERFGLAQLHQLRGRIGRGADRAYCILQAGAAGLDAWRRLKVMEQTADGFRIAEEDFRIRGMGNLLGKEQSGIPSLRVGDPLTDSAILEAARREAFTIVSKDPGFNHPDYERLRRRARALYRAVEPFVKVG